MGGFDFAFEGRELSLSRPISCAIFGCDEVATYRVEVHNPDTGRHTIDLCDHHKGMLDGAREIFEALQREIRHTKVRREEDRDRERSINDWARVFLQTFPNAEPDPDVLAKRALEFAHAMIGRLRKYRHLVIGDQIRRFSEAETPAARRNADEYYDHNPDLFKTASKWEW